MTTGDITKHALRVLDLMGYEIWRNNNIAVRGRGFIGKKGVSDIIGFDRRTGLFVMCEVKNKGDRVSKDQVELLAEAKNSGCRCYMAGVDKNGEFELKEF